MGRSYSVNAVALAMVLAHSLGLAACVRADATRPIGALDAYVAALEAGDYDKAYDFMSDAYRREHSRADFVRMMKENPGDVRETSRRLKQGRRSVAVTAVFRYDEVHDELKLVDEGGTWKIASDPLDFYPQDTPRNTLRSFLRATELGRYDVLVRLVPKDFAMTEQEIKAQFEGDQKQSIADLVTRLRGAIHNRIEVEGDAARLLWGDNREVMFKREDGVWKIEDFR